MVRSPATRSSTTPMVSSAKVLGVRCYGQQLQRIDRRRCRRLYAASATFDIGTVVHDNTYSAGRRAADRRLCVRAGDGQVVDGSDTATDFHLEYHSGAATVHGGAGSDAISYSDDGAGVTHQSGAGTATGVGGTTTFTSIENANGGDGNDTITGNAGANALIGNGRQRHARRRRPAPTPDRRHAATIPTSSTTLGDVVTEALNEGNDTDTVGRQLARSAPMSNRPADRRRQCQRRHRPMPRRHRRQRRQRHARRRRRRRHHGRRHRRRHLRRRQRRRRGDGRRSTRAPTRCSRRSATRSAPMSRT